MHYTANADYEERDTRPLHLAPGDVVSTGPEDRAWPGWIWASDGDGRAGYVPSETLRPLEDGRFAAIKNFDPSVLTIRRGDRLESIHQIHGWHWCRDEHGGEGWVAGYLLRPCGG